MLNVLKITSCVLFGIAALALIIAGIMFFIYGDINTDSLKLGDESMTHKEVLDDYRHNGFSVSDLCREKLTSAQMRNRIYSLIPNNPKIEIRALLLAMFREEMRYREALWNREIEDEDEDDLSENIYLCAFLLHQIGEAEDVLLIWKAKRLNMDVGCMIDANFLVGAGLKNTRDYLDQLGTVESQEIRTYIDSWELTTDDIESWVEFQIAYFGRSI